MTPTGSLGLVPEGGAAQAAVVGGCCSPNDRCVTQPACDPGAIGRTAVVSGREVVSVTLARLASHLRLEHAMCPGPGGRFVPVASSCARKGFSVDILPPRTPSSAAWNTGKRRSWNLCWAGTILPSSRPAGTLFDPGTPPPRRLCRSLTREDPPERTMEDGPHDFVADLDVAKVRPATPPVPPHTRRCARLYKTGDVTTNLESTWLG